MKFSLFLLLLTVVTSGVLRRITEEPEEEKKEYNYNYGAIVVSEEQQMVFNRLIGNEDLKWDVKMESKDYRTMEETFVQEQGEVFQTLKKVGKPKLISDINILQGLLGTKFDVFINRRISTYKLYGEYLEQYLKFCEEAKNGEIGKWNKFYIIYNDTTIPTEVDSLKGYIYKRSDTKYDLIFISASQEFEIPPIKTPKEGVTITEKNKDDDKNYDITYPTEFSEEQNEAIQKWFDIVNLKGICSLLGIEL